MEATIMIPAFNAGLFLDEAIESALRQTYRGAYEILIVNDGSTDETPNIGRFYEERNPGIVRFIDQPKLGQGATRNRLLKEAKGDIFLGLDGDDILAPEALERTLEAFRDGSVGFVYSDHSEMDVEGYHLRNRRKELCHPGFNELILHSHFPGALRAFRKTALNGNIFREDMNVALDYGFMLSALPIKPAHIPEVLYDYRRHNSGVTGTYIEEQKLNAILLLTEHLQNNSTNKGVCVVFLNEGRGVYYYDHIVEGESVMSEENRDRLRSYRLSE